MPGVAAYGEAITALMRRRSIPGASVAVAKNGKLVLARGYGYADQNTGAPAQPDSIYRIASISKTFTSAAILHLVEQGKLSLDDNFLDITDRCYHASPIQQDYIRPAARKLGIESVGWHTFRHTYRTWLDATGAPLGVQQKLLRHAHIGTMMQYGNALMESKRDANSKVVRMARPLLQQAQA